MATRNRTAITNVLNQENTEKIKGSNAAIPGKVKRTALGEIGNKVNTQRGVQPIDRSSLLAKDIKKTTLPQKNVKPLEKVTEKPRVQIVKPVIKTVVNEANTKAIIPLSPTKEVAPLLWNHLHVEDIDEEDKGNSLLVTTYSKDIYEYLRNLEKKYAIKKGYLTGQEVTPKMRSVLIDWLVEVHQQFRLLQETLYLTVAIIDRFLQAFVSIDRKRLQLVGVTAMFIASKYEEICPPSMLDFVFITDNAYTKQEVLQMEGLILRTLDFSFGRPLPIHFLRRYSRAGKVLPVHHAMAKYFLEQSLVNYEMCHYPPSITAAAAFYLANIVIGNDEADAGKLVWTDTLVHYSSYTKDDILSAVRDIATIMTNVDQSKYQAVRKKYVQVKYMKISVRPELSSPIMVAMTQAGKQ